LLDKAAELLSITARQAMKTTMNIKVGNQRVTGLASGWHRCACQNGVVGGNF
jgi:hypothetical protein